MKQRRTKLVEADIRSITQLKMVLAIPRVPITWVPRSIRNLMGNQPRMPMAMTWLWKMTKTASPWHSLPRVHKLLVRWAHSLLSPVVMVAIYTAGSISMAI